MILQIILTTLLYRATNTRKAKIQNVLAVLKQCLVLVQKEQWDVFPVQSSFVSA